MIQRNLDVRSKMKEKGVTQWMLSDYFHVHENTIARNLRHELSEPVKQKYIAAIEEIAEEMKEGDLR